MIDKKEVGHRLRKFGESKFGQMKLLAESLDMTSQSLQSYLTGRSIPGAVILSKLKALGCDTDWLLLNKDTPSVSYLTMKENVLTGDELALKDRIILSQAEEIQQLKDDLNKLKKKIETLEHKTKKIVLAAGQIPD